jgi:hypothetical protein
VLLDAVLPVSVGFMLARDALVRDVLFGRTRRRIAPNRGKRMNVNRTVCP